MVKGSGGLEFRVEGWSRVGHGLRGYGLGFRV